MPKKRKTRKQKISSEKKQSLVPKSTQFTGSSDSASTQVAQKESAGEGMMFSLPTNYRATHPDQKEKKPIVVTASISTSEYGYLGKDLMRTALLSGAIIVAELLIRLFYNH